MKRWSMLAMTLLSMPGVVHADAWFRSRNADIEAGNERLRKKDAAGALTRYDAAARRLPSSPGVHLDRGLALLAQKKYAPARQALLLATEPPASAQLRADAYYNLGLAFLHEQNPAEAVDAFRRALQARPGDQNAAWNLELALRRLQEEKKKKEEQRQQQAEKEQEKQPDKSPDKQEPGKKDPGKQDEGKEKNAETAPSPPADPRQADKKPEAEEQASESGKPAPALPADSARILDALERNEESLEQHRARARVGSERRRPSKDW